MSYELLTDTQAELFRYWSLYAAVIKQQWFVVCVELGVSVSSLP